MNNRKAPSGNIKDKDKQSKKNVRFVRNTGNGAIRSASVK